MTAVERTQEVHPPWADPQGRAARAFDAANVLSVYSVLLLLIPSTLVVEPLGGAGSPANLFGLGLLAWWAVSTLVPGLGVSGRQPVRRAAGFVVAAFTLSYAAAAFRGVDALEQRAADRGMLTILSLAGVALVAADGITDRQGLLCLVRRLVSLGAIMGAVGGAQSLVGLDIAPIYSWIPGLKFNDTSAFFFAADIRRVASTTGHPIEFGMVMVLLLPLGIHQALHAPRHLAVRRWTAVAFISLGIALSVSRSAFVGVAAAGVVLIACWPQLRTRRAFVGLCAGFLGIRLVAPGTLGSVWSGFTQLGSDPSIQGRTQDYSVVGRFIRERPFFGRGFSTFLPDRYILLDNQYIGSVIEIGFIGTFVLLALFVTAIACALAAARRTVNLGGRQLGQALAASITAALVGMATFDALGFSMFAGLLFLLSGSAGAYWRVAPDQSGTAD